MGNPTSGQMAAINERDRTLLVSAAAGAGKTFTLTRRIIETIKSDGNLSEMLIVTFTRAAAAELRERIAKALNDAVAENGYTPHLARQLLALPTAKISTIDSFCLDLVRANAAELGLSPAFRLSDGAENQLLLDSIVKGLVEDCYEGAVAGVTPDAFRSLVESLMTRGGIAKTEEVLLGLYDKTRNYARSYHLLADAAALLSENAEKPPFETPWGVYIKERTEGKLAAFPARLREILPRVEADAVLQSKSHPQMIGNDLEDVMSVLQALKDGDYTAAKGAFDNLKRTRFSGFRATAKQPSSSEYPLAIELSKLHKALLETLADLKEKFYLYSADEWREILSKLAEKSGLLYRIVDELTARIDAEKRRRGLLSFSDLSRYAFSLLCRAEGGKTPLAEELSHSYRYVYVDEYQDVNEVQHRIFEALAPARGRFMVGDVKQSIYGFRGARPDIFAALRRDFPVYREDDQESDSAVLSLATNFRSDPAVLAFVNLVFGRHMATGLGELLGYVEEADRLTPPKEKLPSGDRVTVALFEDGAYCDTDDEGETADASAEEEAGEEESPTPGMREAAYVAAEIKRLLGTPLNGEKLKEKDFAILVRTRGGATRFAEALEKLGIKSEFSREQSFFLKPEILLVLSLLNSIDNPYRDVYLAGLLLSPLYGFTMNDLIRIRKETEGEEKEACALYDAVRAYAVLHPENEGLSRFLSDLARYRRMAEGCPVHILLWQLYRESGLLSIAAEGEGGRERRENLLFFYDYARRFEAAAYRGLYNFISYVTQAMMQGQTIEETEASAVREDAVRIMTMHKSKGLEFPVCFVCDCGHAFNTSDDHDYVLFDGAGGLALRLRDESGYGILKNPVYNVLASQIDDRTVEEGLRLFYVAMTRAVSRLYVTATVKDAAALMEKAKPMDTPLDKATTYAARTFTDLLVSAVGTDGSYDFFINGTPFLPTAEAPAPADAAADEIEETENAENTEEPAPPPDGENRSPEGGADKGAADKGAADKGAEEDEGAYVDVIEARFSFVYPDTHLTEIAGKYAVSHLHPGALDESESEECTLGEDEEETAPALETKPAFLDGEGKTDAAQMGTATHLFMQFCDFARLEQDGVRAELARLAAEKFITQEDAKLVRIKEVEAFLKTALFAAMRESGARIHRELRFHARFPAAAFVENAEKRALYAGETVLVQGVMDAVLETASGELWLIDYKTDRLWGEERTDRNVAEEKLRARHGTQLSYYAAACRDIFGRLPDRVMIYSLALGDTVDLPTTLPEGL